MSVADETSLFEFSSSSYFRRLEINLNFFMRVFFGRVLLSFQTFRR